MSVLAVTGCRPVGPSGLLQCHQPPRRIEGGQSARVCFFVSESAELQSAECRIEGMYRVVR